MRLHVDAPAEIYLKLENLQPIGSFKLRGAYNAMRNASSGDLARGVVTASAGNMAQGVAWAARTLGVPCEAVVPDHAPRTKLAAIERLGARTTRVPFDRWWRVLVEHRYEPLADRAFIHPVSDPAVIAGNGTVGLEILEDLPDVETIVVPCGGGGLFSGIAAAASMTGVRVVPVEPESSRALHDALEAGRPARVEAVSIADGLNAPFAGGIAIRTCVALGVEPVLVSEDEIADAFRFLYTRAKLACEPAGAAATAALLARKIALEPGETVVSVVSGGNAAPQVASGILALR